MLTLVALAALATAGSPPLSLTVFSWNVHWQCGSNRIPGCRAAATQKLVELSREHAADLIVAAELEHNASAPVDLPSHGLGSSGSAAWKQVNGSCRYIPKQPRGVRFTVGTLILWVSSDAFGSGIPRALGTAAPTACTFAVGSVADGCRAAGPGAGALPPDRVPCNVSKHRPTALDSP
jgi:hypothetical protein